MCWPVVALACRLLAVLLVLALWRIPSARAQEDTAYDGDAEAAPAPGDYDEALAPYGSWIEDGQYGWVWEPTVSLGWAPYVEGYWAWSPNGWTWVSAEPWGWTFHYGRWVLLPAGWVWVPGSVWGPAWVDWFWSDGFVGWAPLAPFGTQVTVINPFVFCHARDFTSHHLARLVVDHRFLPDRVIHRWQHRDPDHARPPSLHHVERVSHQQITRFESRPPGTLAPARGGRRLAQPAREPQRAEAHRLGHAWAGGGLRPGEATLGHPWHPGPMTDRPAGPRLARPVLAPAPVAAHGRPPAVLGHAAPHAGAPPGPSLVRPRGWAPGLTGARRLESGPAFGPGAVAGHQLHAAGGFHRAPRGRGPAR